MDDIIEMTLYGGPLDGNTIEINRDHLKLKPIIGVEDVRFGLVEYVFDEGKFIWCEDPGDPKWQRGFIFDDDGNEICELEPGDDPLDLLQLLEDAEERDGKPPKRDGEPG